MFSKNGGNMGEQGSVAWMFERKSQILIEHDAATEDQLMNLVLEAGADDLKDHGDSWEGYLAPENHEAGSGGVAKRRRSRPKQPKSPWWPRT